MADTLLRLSGVTERTTIKRSKLYNMIAEGKFPKPMKIDGCAVWPASAVDQWVAERVESWKAGNGERAA